MDPQDREIAEQFFSQTAGLRGLSTGELVVKAGKFLLGTPYVGQTLEVSDSEKLVINLRELDCTTFAENCLALARTLRMKKPEFDDFARQLQFIRYRDGIRNGYPSRLHYFSDWIYDNNRKKTVKDMSQEIAHTLIPNLVNFMTTHKKNYPALTNNPDFMSTMAGLEAEISGRMTWFIPKNNLPEFEDKLNDGDILGITTDIEGLDISHVVVALRIDGRIRFIHASSTERKVVISDEPLFDYLSRSKMSSGIMVARPL